MICTRHRRIEGVGIHSKVVTIAVNMKPYEVINKDDSLEKGFVCPKCGRTVKS